MTDTKKYYCSGDLKNLGWSKKQIKALGEPDKKQPTGYYDYVLHLWDYDRINAIMLEQGGFRYPKEEDPAQKEFEDALVRGGGTMWDRGRVRRIYFTDHGLQATQYYYDCTRRMWSNDTLGQAKLQALGLTETK